MWGSREPGSQPALILPAASASAPRDGAHIAVIGNFPPTRCGLATFTCDMVNALRSAAPRARIDVYAMTEGALPSDVTATYCGSTPVVVPVGERDAYRAHGEAIALSGAEVVWVQHEFGIFGGPAGAWLIDLLKPVAAPLVVTLHTVLDSPDPDQRRVMEWLVDRAARLVVMSRRGAQTLARVYGVAAERIEVIEHGAPDRPFGRSQAMKARFGLEGRDVMMTFGLLSPNKGLEHVIAALPTIAATRPQVIYCIAGVTHPKLAEQEGEAYRDSLKAMVQDLGMERHVLWVDRFLETDELLELIEATDIYITPYRNAQQSTSGTLSYAVALGKAVVSTPYCHASELLADDVGLLVPFDDAAAIGETVAGLLENPALLDSVQRRAYQSGRATIWPAFGRKSAALIDSLRVPENAGRGALTIGSAGFEALCDDTGILQHAVLAIPDRNHGYCIDDNARALMLTATAEDGLAARARTFAAFVGHAWNADNRRFRNFMGYDRRWLEDAGSPDSCGRTLWALGVTARSAHDPDLREWARQMWHRSAPAALEHEAPRAMAFAMLGADALLDADPADTAARAILQHGQAQLTGLYAASASDGWQWFEPQLSYDNCRLPHALLQAGTRLGDDEAVNTALTALGWIIARQTAPQGHFRPVGSQAFLTGDGDPFDQQAVDAWATVDAAAAADRVRPDERWRVAARAAFAWFFGANDRGAAVADAAAGICHDGITPRGLNRNRGAESVLSLHLAARSLRALEQRAPRAAPPPSARPGLSIAVAV